MVCACAVGLALAGCGGGEPTTDGVAPVDAGGAASKEANERVGAAPVARNLLLISIDTLRTDALGAYGGTRKATPNLDLFAGQAVVFESAWTHTPKTAPAHMSMFTSLPPRVHGVGNLNTLGAQRLSASIHTLPEILEDAGFRTAGFTGGGNAKGSLGFDRGFQTFDDMGESLDHKLVKVEPWLKQAEASGQPWFCFLHTYQVHDPYLPPGDYIERFVKPGYDGKILSSRAAIRSAIDSGDDLAPDLKGNEKITWNYWFRVDESSEQDMAHLHDLYTAGVAHMDALLGAFLKRLIAAGVADDTIIVITSDHGEEFGEHGQVRHDQLYVELAHVPMLVMFPGRAHAGMRIEAPIRHIDLLPSLLELLAVEDSGELRLGRSWVDWIEAGASTETEIRSVLGEHRSGRDRPLDIFTLREGPLTLYDQRGEIALYDRRQDPGEVVPQKRPVVTERLESLLRSQQAQLDVLSTSVGSGTAIEMSDEMRRELEALGYLSVDEDALRGAGASDEDGR
ncbi:Arylsulfatase [Planctomycetes bacterium Pla163]|uniref:Arylsulfatase n=1 Tax=Rohdeia mirabilis TaxID=2528008 RepID=A0A518D128_9BACT|nr:Arylsulfatase [Planctomycetes bacterium Pla163]